LIPTLLSFLKVSVVKADILNFILNNLYEEYKFTITFMTLYIKHMKPIHLKTSLVLAGILFFIFFPSFLQAQVEEKRVYQFGEIDAIHIVSLQNGNVLRGRVLDFPYQPKPETKITILFYEEKVVVKFKDIVKIEVTGPEEDAIISTYYPSEGEEAGTFRSENLFASSTAIPMKKGVKEIKAIIPTAAAYVNAEFGLGAGFSVSAGFTIPGSVLILQGKYGAKVANNFYLGGGVTTGTSFGFGNEWAGVIYGIMTFGNEKSFFNLQFGSTLFPHEGEAFFILPGFSSQIRPRFRIGAEIFIISDVGELYIPYLLPTAGWTFKNKNGGIDIGPTILPELFEEESIPFIPAATIYFRFK